MKTKVEKSKNILPGLCVNIGMGDGRMTFTWVMHEGRAKAFVMRYRPGQGHRWERAPKHDLESVPVRADGDLIWLSPDDARVVGLMGVLTECYEPVLFSPHAFFEEEAKAIALREEQARRAKEEEAARLKAEADQMIRRAEQARAQAAQIETELG